MKTQTQTTAPGVAHTPVPWTTDGRWIVQEVDGRSFWPGQYFIADCIPSMDYKSEGQSNADAAFIVQAVNSHQALVDACEAALADMLKVRHDPFTTCACAEQLALSSNQLRAALKLAKGEAL